MTDLLRQISRGVNLSLADVAKIIRSAPHRYKVFTIEKRSPGAVRTIAQPSPDLKFVQRFLIRIILPRLSVSPAAMGYRKGLSIRSNATAHIGAKCLLKLDFKDFFPSIRPVDVTSRLKKAGFELSEPDEFIIRQVFFWKGGETEWGLAIGAPSSPPLSNAVMYELDAEVSQLCSRVGVVYTRYADDLTFSGDESDVLAVEVEINRIVQEMASPRLRLNNDKRGLYRRGMKQMVTGLVLTPQSQVSMGRQRKRSLSAAVHRAIVGKASRKELHQTRGWLAFANSVEPEFVERLKRKYGATVVDALLYGLKSRLPPSAGH